MKPSAKRKQTRVYERSHFFLLLQEINHREELMKTTSRAKPHGAMNIIWEGLKLPTNDCTLLCPILVITFFSSSLIFLFNYLLLVPLVTDLSMKSILIGRADPNSPDYSTLLTAIVNDLKELGIIEIVELVVSFIISSLLATVTVFALTTVYTRKTPTKCKELFSNISWRMIKGATITQLIVALLVVGCIILLSLSVGLVSFFYTMFSSSYVWLMTIIVLGVIVAIVAIPLSLYLYVLFKTSVVVSVADEEGCSGLDAIEKASKLVKGRRKQAILVVFVELVASALLFAVYNFAVAHAQRNKVGALAVGFVQVAIAVVVNMFVWSVHTVYYYECKKSLGEGIPAEGGFVYAAVATHVDEAFP